MEKIIHPPADPVIRGHDILASNVYPCYTCHTLNIADATQPWVGNIGPALNGVADRAAGPRSTVTGLSATDYLVQSIHEPTAFLVPGYGPLMPQLNLPDCELQAIVAYLCTQSETGQPQCTINTDAYAQQCAGAAAPAAELTAEATETLTSEATSDASVLSSEATAESTVPAVDASSAPVGEATAEATP
jgi:cytochrome c2